MTLVYFDMQLQQYQLKIEQHRFLIMTKATEDLFSNKVSIFILTQYL